MFVLQVSYITTNKCPYIFHQLDEKTQQQKMTELALEEKRSQLIEAESHAREVEDRYITNASIVHDRTVNDLRVSCLTLYRVEFSG